MSDAFRLRIRPAQPQGGASTSRGAGAQRPHADWLDVLALASKHGYEDLFDKATDVLVEEVRRSSIKQECQEHRSCCWRVTSNQGYLLPRGRSVGGTWVLAGLADPLQMGP
jgi:hypothetical protein